MTSRITHAQPPLQFIAPDFNPMVLWLGRSLLPFWLRRRKHVVDIDVHEANKLVDLFHQFEAGKIRLMLAFRHPSTIDPLCVGQVVWNQLPAIARRQGNPFRAQPHVQFIYDRGIPLWAGPAVGWLISKLGGTPIRRGSLDTAGLRSIRNLFVNSDFPMAAAPEGGTNGHNEIVSPIEPGIAQFGFWCAEDLEKAGRNEDVLIVPIGIQYRFVTAPWKTLADLLSQLEAESGIAADPAALQSLTSLSNGVQPSPEQEKLLYQRLIHLGEHLLTQMETFYCKYYGQAIAPVPSTSAAASHGADPSTSDLGTRLHALLDRAIAVAEQSLGLKPKGSLTDRCRRIEQSAWDRIYRDDLKSAESLSPLERGLADLVAEEANLRLWHMRLVETFVSVTGKYVAERPTVERFADTTLLIWKMLRQIQRQPASQPPDLGDHQAKITIGDPLSVSQRLPDYRHKRRQAIATVTQELQAALESTIKP
ncbi:MAG: 1-acyl-sn-glycerol-3-phosphate acyltransferase [Elainellaceae cyanobacterium]